MGNMVGGLNPWSEVTWKSLAIQPKSCQIVAANSWFVFSLSSDTTGDFVGSGTKSCASLQHGTEVATAVKSRCGLKCGCARTLLVRSDLKSLLQSPQEKLSTFKNVYDLLCTTRWNHLTGRCLILKNPHLEATCSTFPDEKGLYEGLGFPFTFSWGWNAAARWHWTSLMYVSGLHTAIQAVQARCFLPPTLPWCLS